MHHNHPFGRGCVGAWIEDVTPLLAAILDFWARPGCFLSHMELHGGEIVAFCALLKLIPTYNPESGRSGFSLTGA